MAVWNPMAGIWIVPGLGSPVQWFTCGWPAHRVGTRVPPAQGPWCLGLFFPLLRKLTEWACVPTGVGCLCGHLREGGEVGQRYSCWTLHQAGVRCQWEPQMFSQE